MDYLESNLQAVAEFQVLEKARGTSWINEITILRR